MLILVAAFVSLVMLCSFEILKLQLIRYYIVSKRFSEYSILLAEDKCYYYVGLKLFFNV